MNYCIIIVLSTVIVKKKPNQLKKERFYKPYSFKEYKDIMEKYKSNRFGGLGINMNNDWQKREKVMNEIKKFEDSVYQNFYKK